MKQSVRNCANAAIVPRLRGKRQVVDHPPEFRYGKRYILASPLVVLRLTALAVATKSGLAGLATIAGRMG